MAKDIKAKSKLALTSTMLCFNIMRIMYSKSNRIRVHQCLQYKARFILSRMRCDSLNSLQIAVRLTGNEPCETVTFI